MTAQRLNRRTLCAAAGLLALSGSVRAQAQGRRSAGERERAAFAHYRAPGPLPVQAANPLSFPIPEQSKNLLVRVTYPDPSAPSGGGRQFPVILFSHSGGGSKDLYDRIAEHWASHGYVSIQPTHLNSVSLGYKVGAVELMKLIQSRVADMTFLLDHLGEVAEQSPALAGRLDVTKIAAGGHGTGTLTALALAGLRLRDPKGGLHDFRDRRVKTLISLYGSGPSAITDPDWSAVNIPVLAVAGTGDPGEAPGGGLAPWRWRLAAYELTSGPEHYAVSVAGGDHDLGGLIGREKPGDAPDTEGLAIVSALSAAFLDEVFASDRNARRLLDHGDIPVLTHDRAFLEAR